MPKYSEPTKQLNVRVPKSKYHEILHRVNHILREYQVEEGKLVASEPKTVEVDAILDVEYDPTREVEAPEPKKPTKTLKKEKIKYDFIKSLPYGTTLVKSYGPKGALKQLLGVFYTKRMVNNKIEIIRHENKQSATEYAENNFK